MPTFTYYATFDESISLLGDLCVAGFRVITEPSVVDTPVQPRSFTAVDDELITILSRAPCHYLVGSRILAIEAPLGDHGVMVT